MVERSLLTSPSVPAPADDEGPWFAPSRPTASARYLDTGLPLDRGEFTAQLLARLARESLDAGGAPTRSAFLSAAEAETIAELLDELAGVFPDEELGQLAGTLSARMWERLPR